VDYIGFGYWQLAVGACDSSRQGPEDDWFGSNFIVGSRRSPFVCLVNAVDYEWRHDEPIVD